MPLNQPDCKGIPKHVRMGVPLSDIGFDSRDPGLGEQIDDMSAPVAFVTGYRDGNVSEWLVAVTVDWDH